MGAAKIMARDPDGKAAEATAVVVEEEDKKSF